MGRTLGVNFKSGLTGRWIGLIFFGSFRYDFWSFEPDNFHLKLVFLIILHLGYFKLTALSLNHRMQYFIGVVFL